MRIRSRPTAAVLDMHVGPVQAPSTGFARPCACALCAKSMHTEPPLQGDDGPFCGLKQRDQKHNGERDDYRHKRSNRKPCVAGQSDDQRRQKMTGYQDRKISRKVIRLLMCQILCAMRAAGDRFEEPPEQSGLAAARTSSLQTTQYRYPARSGQNEATGRRQRLVYGREVWFYFNLIAWRLHQSVMHQCNGCLRLVAWQERRARPHQHRHARSGKDWFFGLHKVYIDIFSQY